jgi:hypothetical protein
LACAQLEFGLIAEPLILDFLRRRTAADVCTGTGKVLLLSALRGRVTGCRASPGSQRSFHGPFQRAGTAAQRSRQRKRCQDHRWGTWQRSGHPSAPQLG